MSGGAGVGRTVGRTINDSNLDFRNAGVHHFGRMPACLFKCRLEHIKVKRGRERRREKGKNREEKRETNRERGGERRREETDERCFLTL